jgi:hypothetical protein
MTGDISTYAQGVGAALRWLCGLATEAPLPEAVEGEGDL